MRTSHVVLGALIAFSVSVICLLPPGIHFVTGPLGPFIGGYVSGKRFRLNGFESVATGTAMGIAIGGTLVAAFEYLPFMPHLSLQASLPLSVVAAFYVGALGTIGAWFASGRSAAS